MLLNTDNQESNIVYKQGYTSYIQQQLESGKCGICHAHHASIRPPVVIAWVNGGLCLK
jgi:predicted CXXCH cytochrome family protein